ncbi:hypothetical protein HPB47_017804, partial [Ixodes persulcatus]
MRPCAGLPTCPGVWDGILCWQPAPAGTMAQVNCPDYVYGFDTREMATKWCTENGTWYVSPEHGQPWTNYTRCFPQGATMQSENISLLE